MKINKRQLRQIINEEVKTFENKMTSQDAAKALRGQRGSKGVGASGINDAERGVMMELLAALKLAAAAGNITSGTTGTLIERLMTLLQKVAGAPAAPPEEVR
tara:strand:+ start:5448 stop:5753 length:306 start_codon:yes stop_codon:yes gene_type:complete